MPDDELLAAAERGESASGPELEAQVRRMLADPRSQSLASNFAFQWLNMAKLGEIQPDVAMFPNLNGDIRNDFRQELRLFIDSVFRENHNVLDLLSADYTFVNERLALHYGIRDVKGDQFRRVQLKESKRFGLLGKGAVLMVTSYPNRTAPVLRGSFILERILGTPPAAPPPPTWWFDLGMTAMPCWTHQRSSTWAGVLPPARRSPPRWDRRGACRCRASCRDSSMMLRFARPRAGRDGAPRR